VTVQDDEREKELCRLFNLEWDPDHARGGTDAHFILEVGGSGYHIDAEVKSTTSGSVSTARDVGLEHISKWRRMFWVIGFYGASQSRGPQLEYSLCLTPLDLEPWIAETEAKILPDFDLARRASRHLTLEDLHAICGDKTAYSLEDAKRLHKSQWSKEEYGQALDIEIEGERMISPANMLEILKLRAKYIAERGATVNNPHIPKTFLNEFSGRRIVNNQAATIRSIAGRYIHQTQTHPFRRIT
jgi:hypothetical protein